MILYPFPPGSALKCGIAGFDEEKREPAAELYLLAPGAVPPEQRQLENRGMMSFVAVRLQ